MDELAKNLYDLAAKGDWEELNNALDSNTPDLSSSDFVVKVADQKYLDFTIGKKDVSSNAFNGSVPTEHLGYILANQVIKTKNGEVLVNPLGEYTYTIINQDVLRKILDGGSHNFSEKVRIVYKKERVLTTVSHQIISIASAKSDATTVKKLLQMNCCPNSNTANYVEISGRAKLNAGFNFSPASDESIHAESRPLINAIKYNRPDIASELISHSCPCCDGNGAKITPYIIGEAQKIGGAMLELIQANA